MKQDVRIFQVRGREDSKVMGEAVVTIGQVELRLTIVKSQSGEPFVRWPRKNLPSGGQCYVARMVTQKGTEDIEAMVLHAWNRTLR